MVVFTNTGLDSSLQIRANDGDYQDIKGLTLNGRVNIGQDLSMAGNFFTVKWFGETSKASPVFEGFLFESVTDQGITNG